MGTKDLPPNTRVRLPKRSARPLPKKSDEDKAVIAILENADTYAITPDFLALCAKKIYAANPHLLDSTSTKPLQNPPVHPNGRDNSFDYMMTNLGLNERQLLEDEWLIQTEVEGGKSQLCINVPKVMEASFNITSINNPNHKSLLKAEKMREIGVLGQDETRLILFGSLPM